MGIQEFVLVPIFQLISQHLYPRSIYFSDMRIKTLELYAYSIYPRKDDIYYIILSTYRLLENGAWQTLIVGFIV
jgi:hypothetical protein